eukprot:1627403-Amphidinium_carterae.1
MVRPNPRRNLQTPPHLRHLVALDTLVAREREESRPGLDHAWLQPRTAWSHATTVRQVELHPQWGLRRLGRNIPLFTSLHCVHCPHHVDDALWTCSLEAVRGSAQRRKRTWPASNAGLRDAVTCPSSFGGLSKRAPVKPFLKLGSELDQPTSHGCRSLGGLPRSHSL